MKAIRAAAKKKRSKTKARALRQNSALTEGGPVSVDCNNKPNPPFGAANGSQKL